MRTLLLALLSLPCALAQAAAPLLLAPESSRWELQGKAGISTYAGRQAIHLDGGAATVKDLELRDGVIDVDVATPAARGFFGIQFRVDASLNWQIYSGPGFIGAVDIPRDEWFHVRLVVSGAQAKFFVKDMEKPALVVGDLKSGVRKGQVALAALTGAVYFSEFSVRETPEAPWKPSLPPMPAGTITNWSISPSLDAISRNRRRGLRQVR